MSESNRPEEHVPGTGRIIEEDEEHVSDVLAAKMLDDNHIGSQILERTLERLVIERRLDFVPTRINLFFTDEISLVITGENLEMKVEPWSTL